MYSCLFLLCSESRVAFRFGRCQFDDGRSSHSSACGFSLSPENHEQCFVLSKFFGTCSSVPTNPFSWMISRWGRASGKHWAGRAPKGDMYLEGDCLRVGFVLMENRIIQHSMRLCFGQQHFKFEMIFTCCSSWGARAWRGIGSTKIGRRQGKAESKNKTRKVRCCSSSI